MTTLRQMGAKIGSRVRFIEDPEGQWRTVKTDAELDYEHLLPWVVENRTMTDTTHEAPERIWAGNDGFANCWDWEDPEPEWTEYVRADLVQAAVAAALREAIEIYRKLSEGSPVGASDGQTYHVRYVTANEFSQAILTCITPDAQAALDRVVAAERERGFWAGRSCGGSKAEIHDALVALIGQDGLRASQQDEEEEKC